MIWNEDEDGESRRSVSAMHTGQVVRLYHTFSIVIYSFDNLCMLSRPTHTVGCISVMGVAQDALELYRVT